MELTTLSAITLSAAVSLAQGSDWVTGEDMPRVEAMSATVAKVVHDKGCVIPGEVNCEEKTAYALLAIINHESGFAEDVYDCSRCRLGGPYCDHGKAISVYQMHAVNWGGHSRQEVCSDFYLATSLALDTLKRSKGSWHSKFRNYAGRKESGYELYLQHQTIMLFQARKETKS